VYPVERNTACRRLEKAVRQTNSLVRFADFPPSELQYINPSAFVEGNRRGRVRSPMIPSQKAHLRVGQVTHVDFMRIIGRY